MKYLSVLLMISGLSFASDNYVELSKEGSLDGTVLRYNYISPCRSWTYFRTARSQSAYGCSFSPMSAKSVEFNSLFNVLSNHESRIKTLEEKIAALEAKLSEK